MTMFLIGFCIGTLFGGPLAMLAIVLVSRKS
jgi:hypothetical protein